MSMKKKVLIELDRHNCFTSDTGINALKLAGAICTTKEHKNLAKALTSLRGDGYIYYVYIDDECYIYADINGLDNYTRDVRSKLFKFLDGWITRLLAIAAVIISIMAYLKQ